MSQQLIDLLLPRVTVWLQDSEEVKDEGVKGEGVYTECSDDGQGSVPGGVGLKVVWQAL